MTTAYHRQTFHPPSSIYKPLPQNYGEGPSHQSHQSPSFTVKSFRCLREAQRALIIEMLGSCTTFETVPRPIIDTSTDSPSASPPPATQQKDTTISIPTLSPLVWKVLILDKRAQEIISPIIMVDELRLQGVTMIMQLEADRDPLPSGITAIYYVEAKKENIDIIAEDLRNLLYDKIELNFIDTIDKVHLEQLAKAAQQASPQQQPVTRVMDMWSNFVSLEDNLFTLHRSGLYSEIIKASGEKELQKLLDPIVRGLICALSTMHGIGGDLAGVATMPLLVGHGLTGGIIVQILAEHLRKLSHTKPGESVSLQRPLICIIDRGYDLAAPLRHPSTYNALVHDLLGMPLNKIQSMRTDDSASLFIDSRDQFWASMAGQLFPTVTDAHDAQEAAYQSDKRQFTMRTGIDTDNVTGTEGAGSPSNSPAMASDLTIAISVLPEMQERKRYLVLHRSLCQSILDKLKEKGDWVGISEMEAAPATLAPTSPTTGTTDSRAIQQASKILTLLSNKEIPAADRLRMYLVRVLQAGHTPSENELQLLEKELSGISLVISTTNAKVAINPVTLVRSLDEAQKTLFGIPSTPANVVVTSMTASTLAQAATSGQSGWSDRLNVFKDATSAVLSGALNMLSGNQSTNSDAPSLPRYLDAMLEAIGVPLYSQGLLSSVFSSTQQAQRETAARQAIKSGLTVIDPASNAQILNNASLSMFSHVWLFIVGGASYGEYNCFHDYVAHKATKMHSSATGSKGVALPPIHSLTPTASTSGTSCFGQLTPVFGTTEMLRGDDWVGMLAQTFSKS